MLLGVTLHVYMSMFLGVTLHACLYVNHIHTMQERNTHVTHVKPLSTPTTRKGGQNLNPKVALPTAPAYSMLLSHCI